MIVSMKQRMLNEINHLFYAILFFFLFNYVRHIQLSTIINIFRFFIEPYWIEIIRKNVESSFNGADTCNFQTIE